ncbi:Gp19/Gp15/Gp42 family protein [Cutibacterium sp.]|uniref:Gp19/Gp15/Gp42 family protein n=1 Tax=Cutibacterium sp. TaxID=1912221 RepID=UPI0026DA7815|nr:Gp19/Gp15/Gp42 family protein [Cutibacterium sp.]MDO4413067.1 Gp19/Gp15/Gp42 family protein [Cutibacterium sp.]
MSAAPFATVGDLEARWRGLSQAEQSRAAVLIDDASALIRDTVPGWEGVSEETLRAICCAVVRRAMGVGVDMPAGISSVCETGGPFSQQVSFANPTGDLYLTRAEKARMGVSVATAASIDLLGQP